MNHKFRHRTLFLYFHQILLFKKNSLIVIFIKSFQLIDYMKQTYKVLAIKENKLLFVVDMMDDKRRVKHIMEAIPRF